MHSHDVEVLTRRSVRREDLDSPHNSDSEDDEEVRAQLQAQLARSLGLDLDLGAQSATEPSQQPPEQEQQQGEEEEEQGDQEYDFCLFAGPAPTTKVTLQADEDGPKGPGGIVSRRPTSYYLAARPSAAQLEELRAAAVTGDEVLARSGWRTWALEMPWRVTHITTPAKGVEAKPKMEDGKRRRIGKKRRIALRTKERERKSKAEKEKEAKEAKEDHLKEKKKRLNRIKKLRKRQKERERKIANGEAVGPEDEDGSGSGSE